MALSSNNRVIQTALEALYGVGADPGAFIYLLVANADLPGMAAQEATRNIIQPHLGSRPAQPWQERVPLVWGVEAVGSGDVAVEPHFDAMLQAAGWARVQLTGTATVQAAPIAVGTPTGSWSYTVGAGFTGANRRRVTVICTTAGASGTAQATVAAPAVGLGETAEAAYEVTGVAITDATPITLPGGAEITPTLSADWEVGDQWVIELVPPGIEYWPSSDRAGHKSLVAKYNVDEVMFEARGARFQLGAQWQIGGWPLLNFRGRGLYGAPTEVALGDADFSTIREPEVLDTNSFQIHVEPTDLSAAPWSPTGQSFDLTGGADVRDKSRTNLNNVEIVNHELTASLLVELERISTIDVFALSNMRRRVRATSGTRLGERCEICVANGQIGTVSLREDGGDVMATLPMRCLSPQGAGDDEVCIRFF